MSMMHKAFLRTASSDAKSVARSLKVDNDFDSGSGVRIETRVEGDDVVSTLVESESIPTLLGILDDMIHCQMSAEKLLSKQWEVERSL